MIKIVHIMTVAFMSCREFIDNDEYVMWSSCSCPTFKKVLSLSIHTMSKEKLGCVVTPSLLIRFSSHRLSRLSDIILQLFLYSYTFSMPFERLYLFCTLICQCEVYSSETNSH